MTKQQMSETELRYHFNLWNASAGIDFMYLLREKHPDLSIEKIHYFLELAFANHTGDCSDIELFCDYMDNQDELGVEFHHPILRYAIYLADHRADDFGDAEAMREYFPLGKKAMEEQRARFSKVG